MTVSDARRLRLYAQARAPRCEETAEILMDVVVPPGQDMAAKADLLAAASSMKEYTIRLLLIMQIPSYLGIIGLAVTG